MLKDVITGKEWMRGTRINQQGYPAIVAGNAVAVVPGVPVHTAGLIFLVFEIR